MTLTEKERTTLYSIRVPSETDPHNPEFPGDDPKFPATPTYKIEVPGYKNVWLKDESKNATGTHKDRMAWEIAVTYRDILLAKKEGKYQGKLPQFSIITGGAAGIAIQTELKKYNLPNLKCLVDVNLKRSVVSILKKMGCEIYFTDLTRKVIHWQDILQLTNNPRGLEVTSIEGNEPDIRFYDWLSFEILNQSPDYCYIPFGTGILYRNLLTLSKREVTAEHHDARLSSDVKTLRNCNFMGASISSPGRYPDTMYSPLLHTGDQHWLRHYRYSGFIGPLSDIYSVRDEFVTQALGILHQQSVKCEYYGAAGLALLLQDKPKIGRDKKILIVNTGKVKLPAV